MAHFDTASESIAGFSEVSGRGWMAGPYVAAELADGLFFTGRLAWGTSRNDAAIDVYGDGNLWSGNFNTRRMLARASLHGEYELTGVTLRPQVDLSYMEELQRDYSVSDGVWTVDVAGIRARIARLSVSGEAEWPVGVMGGLASAFVVPQLDWDIANTVSGAQDGKLRGSLELGLRTHAKAEWAGEAAIRYDGIGQRDFRAWAIRLGANFNF